MKMLLLSFSFLGYAFTSCSQNIAETEVPSIVKNALLAQFAEAKNLEWEKEKDFFEADFTIGQLEQTAVLDASGKIVMVKTEIPVSEIPAAVLTSLTSKYKDRKIEEVEKITKNGAVFYEVELDGKLFGKELVLNENGLIENTQKF